jgi:hypothetical protein
MTIHLWCDGSLANSGTADASGNWTVSTTGAGLAAGLHTFWAVAENSLGNQSAAGSIQTVLVIDSVLRTLVLPDAASTLAVTLQLQSTAVNLFVNTSTSAAPSLVVPLADFDKIDVGNGQLIVTGSTSDAVRSWLASGWLFSTQAVPALTGLGYMYASSYTALHPGQSFSSQSFQPNDVFVKYTYVGDANLDGQITAADYAQLDAGYLLHQPASWLTGDFNYDGKIDAQDYALIDESLRFQGAPSLSVASNTTQTLAATQYLASLSIGDNATARLTAGGSKTLIIYNLSFTGSGRLDLADNDLIVAGSDLATVQGWIASGRIYSSTASSVTGLGLLTGAEYAAGNGSKTFDGQPYQATDLLVKFTYLGDANLDGKITATDYAQLNAGYLLHLAPSWFTGDFNYDGKVDAKDFAAINAAYKAQTVALAQAVVTTPVSQANVAPAVPMAANSGPSAAAVAPTTSSSGPVTVDSAPVAPAPLATTVPISLPAMAAGPVSTSIRAAAVVARPLSTVFAAPPISTAAGFITQTPVIAGNTLCPFPLLPWMPQATVAASLLGPELPSVSASSIEPLWRYVMFRPRLPRIVPPVHARSVLAGVK